eukprot:1446159-Alexandrium_andersonii.AAC.1
MRAVLCTGASYTDARDCALLARLNVPCAVPGRIELHCVRSARARGSPRVCTHASARSVRRC